MIKGAQKRLIVVKTTESPFFDEAYFVLRHEPRRDRKTESDMLNEANRILRDSTLHPSAKKRGRRLLASPSFWIGFLCGGAAFALPLLCLLL